jgi:hypothetical protein
MTHNGRGPTPWRAAWREAVLAWAASRALVWIAAAGAQAAIGSRVPGVPSDLPAPVAAVGVRWDALHFAGIVQHGYPASVAQPWAFLPGFPAVVAALGGSWWAGLACSCACSLAGLAVVHRLGELELGRPAARRATWLLALFPGSLFLSAFYSEGLFLLASAAALYAARRERWAWAGLAAGTAALTRTTGVLLLVGLAGLAWRCPPRRPRELAWLALVPGAVAGWAAAAWLRTGDARAVEHAQAIWGRTLHVPLASVWWALGDALNGLGRIGHAAVPGEFEPPWMKVGLLALLAWAIVAGVGAARRLPAPYGLYALAVLLVALTETWPAHPLMSLPRVLAVLFPLHLWMATRRRAFAPALALSAAGLVVLSARFGVWAWAG